MRGAMEADLALVHAPAAVMATVLARVLAGRALRRGPLPTMVGILCTNNHP